MERLERSRHHFRHLRSRWRQCEVLQSRDADTAHAQRLRTSHSCHQAQMVVSDALGIAALGPSAELAMRNRVWISVERRGGGLVEETLLDPAVVGIELGEPEAVLLARAENDVDALGLASLEASDLLTIKAELEQKVGL